VSSIRGIGDAYAFQRLLWLLVGTVIVPTILLSLFGVMAIRNQRAVLLVELDRVRAERLDAGARTVAQSVAALEREAADRAAGCASRAAGTCDLKVDGTSGAWSWTAGEPPPAGLTDLGMPSDLGVSPGWLVSPDGAASVFVAAHDPLRFAWRLDPLWLQDELGARAGDRLPEGGTWTLVPPSADRDGSAERALDRPLAGWHLVLEDRGEPARAVLLRNAWLYPTSLVLLVGLVLVGTVVTLGSATREIRLSRLQTDFVSSVSHELRTPLTSIRLFVETLQSGRLKDPQKVQECLDLLAHETDRLSRMIERVLDWARMEAGRRVYEFESVPAAELAGDALRALRSQRLLEDGPDFVDVDVPADLPEVRADRDAIVEALLNLLQNAVKYTPPPRTIVLRGTAAGGFVGLAVKDDGPGIPKRDRRRVFEKFYQVDTRLSSPAQGTVDRGSGLGLSIVRAVARAHGGRVELETEVGHGSTFTLWLPVVTSMR
jgi:signal transduction histidine kinase